MKLNNGNEIYTIGLGTLLVKGKECEDIVYEAIKQGYRMIDTASAYYNEKQVGKGIKRAIEDHIVKREELFIISKLWIQDYACDSEKAYEQTLKNLQLDYLDLYLLHQPYNDYYHAYKVLERLYKEGKIKNIGVSNFSDIQLYDLIQNHEIVPAINQIEIHPYNQNKKTIQFMKEYDIKPMAWGPFNEGQNNIFNDTLLVELSNKYQCSVAQIMVMWHLQKGHIIIPKTLDINHLIENKQINNKLENNDLILIDQLDKGHSTIIDHSSYLTTKWFNEIKIH